MKKNGATSKGTTRWRCKGPNCDSSTIQTCTDRAQARDLKAFISYATSTVALFELAQQQGVSRWTPDRRFTLFQLINTPDDGDPQHVYDQIFIDGTYTAAGCLLVAAGHDHVITQYWTKYETAHAYTHLLHKIAEPPCVVLDGSQGALTAVRSCWPDAWTQRYPAHAQRVIRRYAISRPRTDAGEAAYALASKLTRITALDQTRDWTSCLHDFGQVFKAFLDEKTPVSEERRALNNQWEWTHLRVRKAYNSPLHLSRKGWLFTYLQPSPNALEPQR